MATDYGRFRCDSASMLNLFGIRRGMVSNMADKQYKENNEGWL